MTAQSQSDFKTLQEDKSLVPLRYLNMSTDTGLDRYRYRTKNDVPQLNLKYSIFVIICYPYVPPFNAPDYGP